jgi:hypothetical protein
LSVQARSEAGGLFGHFAARPIEAERQSDHDPPDGMRMRKFAESPHIFIAIDAVQGEERARELRFQSGDG